MPKTISAPSHLSTERKKYSPKLPPALRDGVNAVKINSGKKTESIKDQSTISRLFPQTYGAPITTFSTGTLECRWPVNVGIVLSGGQAPGGHNVIAGIFDGVKSINQDSKILGFLGGPLGLETGNFIDITSEHMDSFRNTGGFDMIGSGRTKLETSEQFEKCIKVIIEHNIDSIVVIGGDDSNTNAAVLAEYLSSKNVACTVVGCPKTIDGDLKNEHIESPFGFDTAAKTYASLIGNISRDSNSAKKYWHFVKLMGRSASHIGLEVALQTHPNICLISEEVAEREMTLHQIVLEISDIVEARASANKNFGIALIPEGLIEFIPEMKTLIAELNDSLVEHSEELEEILYPAQKVKVVYGLISKKSSMVLKALPNSIQQQLLLDRDPHGNVQVSLIETEKLLIEMVKNELGQREKYNGNFKAINHFFGYEGRCALPSNFDANYAYGLGFGSAVLAKNKLTGYISCIKNLKAHVDDWVAGGVPATMLMNIEKRHGEEKPVIQKALVDLKGKPFDVFKNHRETWALTESYTYPGPIQFYGPPEVCDRITHTLRLSTENNK